MKLIILLITGNCTNLTEFKYNLVDTSFPKAVPQKLITSHKNTAITTTGFVVILGLKS